MSYDFVEEEVPKFIRRLGDRVIEGSNNSTMVFGTDRAAKQEAKLNSGYGHINASNSGLAAGSWHIIVGRTTEDPNFDTDRAYIYLSMRTDADKNLKLEYTPSINGVNTNGTSAAIIKADVVRIVSREDVKIVVGSSSILLKKDEIVLNSPSIRIGDGSKLNEQDRNKLIKDAILGHKHLAPSGPTGPAIPTDPFIAKINLGMIDIIGS